MIKCIHDIQSELTACIEKVLSLNVSTLLTILIELWTNDSKLSRQVIYGQLCYNSSLFIFQGNSLKYCLRKKMEDTR